MPLYYDPSSSNSPKKQDLRSVSYDYDYPADLKLKPGTKVHDDLVDQVMKRANESRHNMEGRYDSWRQVDRTLTAYVRPEDLDETKNVNASAPVLVPISYSTL